MSSEPSKTSLHTTTASPTDSLHSSDTSSNFLHNAAWKGQRDAAFPEWKDKVTQSYHKGPSNLLGTPSWLSSGTSDSGGEEDRTMMSRRSSIARIRRKRNSLEISSELDISRRIDLDVELTWEKWWVLQATIGHRRLFMFLVMVGIFVGFQLIGGILWIVADEEIVINPYVCESPECIQVADDILTKMNDTNDPCEDFYLFSCGSLWETSIREANEENVDDWPLITDQIHYDFTQSRVIGVMMREKDPQVLAYHQACMDIDSRNQRGLEPYFDLLTKHGLSEAEKDCRNISTLCDLSRPLADLTTQHLLIEQLFITVLYPADQGFSITIPKDSSLHSALTFGIEAKIGVIQDALTYLDEQGRIEGSKVNPKYRTTWGNASTIEAYAKLFLCAELNLFPYYVHGQAGPVVWDGFNEHQNLSTLCKFHQPTGTIDNATTNGLVIGTLLWQDFVQDQTIYQTVMPKFPQFEDQLFRFNTYIDIGLGTFFPKVRKLTPSLDSFVRNTESNWTMELDGVLGNYDLTVRFLQWRLLREHGHTLDERMDQIFWPITRDLFECNWIATCLWTSFSDISYWAQTLFLKDIPTERLSGMIELFANYDPVFEKMLGNLTFPKFVDPPLGDSERNELTRRAFRTLILHWPIETEFGDSSTFDTTVGLRLLRFKPAGRIHFLNTIDRKLFTAAKYRSAFVGFLSDLGDPSIEISGSNINRPTYRACQENRTATLVMPLGTYEVPYFGTKFPALDLGGVGIYAVNEYLQFILREGMYYAIDNQHLNSTDQFCGDETYETSNLQVIGYSMALELAAIDFAKRLNSDLWTIPHPEDEGNRTFYNSLNQNVNDLYTDQLSLQIALKLAYEVHEQLVRQNPIVGKMVLPGLEKYNARQLLFMQLAARKCEIYSANKLEHKKNFGPVPTFVAVNVMAGNSKEFSEAFGCKPGSRMNPVNKFNLYEPF